MKTDQKRVWVINTLALIALLVIICSFFVLTRTKGVERPTYYNIQKPPKISATILAKEREEPPSPTDLRPERADIKIEFNIEYSFKHTRQMVPIYEVYFTGNYRIKNPYPHPIDISFLLPLPKTLTPISNLQLLVNHKEPPGVHYRSDGVRFSSHLTPNAAIEVLATYRGQGINNYIYALDHDRRIEELNLRMILSGVEDVKFPSFTILPTIKKKTQTGWNLSWNFNKLITRSDIGVEFPPMPDYASKFAILGCLAPLFLILFLGGLRFSAKVEGIHLNTNHYLLLGICFFTFYPVMFALSKHIPITWSFILSLCSITFFILSLLKKIASPRFALRKGLILLWVFLLFFTLGVLISKMPLFFTIGGLILIATFIWTWTTGIRPRFVPVAETLPSVEARIEDESCDPGLTELLAGLKTEPGIEAETPTVGIIEGTKGFCVSCGQGVASGYKFCPLCGQGVVRSLTCYECGRELYTFWDRDLRFCPGCGAGLEGLEGQTHTYDKG